MSVFRSRARLVALAWLLCQVASLAAFVPEDCCAKHTAIASAKHGDHSATHAGHSALPAEKPADCHESAEAPAPEPKPEPGDACPMHQATGAECPMHRGPSGECCGMSSTCDGPNRPLASLFSFVGILDAPAASISAPESQLASVDRPAPLLHRLVSPDAPPPKL